MVSPAQAQAPKPRFKHTHGHLEAKDYAFVRVADKWQSRSEYSCLLRLWGKESAWNHRADNPVSSAFGIAQLLGEKSKSPHVQIDNGLKYIVHRYKTPCKAWQFWLKQKAKKGVGWY